MCEFGILWFVNVIVLSRKFEVFKCMLGLERCVNSRLVYGWIVFGGMIFWC